MPDGLLECTWRANAGNLPFVGLMGWACDVGLTLHATILSGSRAASPRATGGDICGLTRLAETAVGAPFVGTVAGCLMLAQVLRVLAGGSPDALVDLDLRSIKSRRAVTNVTLAASNPGFQLVA